ncbi:GD18112 [Drosophila simulans]|uniref:GD18112 n=1 Tax=Drosophila simulans TaxID=7240 RepID=B4QWT4_DROSI|nr:GD18112 [Drosophila simulans]
MPSNVSSYLWLSDNNRSISSAMSQMIIALAGHHDYDDDHFGCEVLLGKSTACALRQCGFPRKANLMTPIKCAHRQLIVVDTATDMRF